MIETHVFDTIYMFFLPIVVRVLRYSTHSVQVNLIPMWKDLYITDRQTIERLAKSTASHATARKLPQFSHIKQSISHQPHRQMNNQASIYDEAQ